MRLDHLLSKEHLRSFGASRTQVEGVRSSLGLMGGTFDMVRTRIVSLSTLPSGGRNGVGVGFCACTLLGPEGPDVPASVGAAGSFWAFPCFRVVRFRGGVPPVL